MSQEKRNAIQQWLPVALTLAMLLTSLAFRGGVAEKSISGLRDDVAELSRNLSVSIDDIRQVREQLVEAKGYREGLQTRLTIIERRLEDTEKRNEDSFDRLRGELTAAALRREDDQEKIRANFTYHKGLIDNNKTSIRVLRSSVDLHLYGPGGNSGSSINDSEGEGG